MNTQPEQTGGDYLCLLVGDCEYGIRTTAVKTVFDTVTVRKIPKSPNFVQGVANIQGRIVPVVDVARRFGLPAPPENVKSTFVLVQHGVGVYGLAADAINSIVEVETDNIEPINPLLATREAPFINAMAKVDERLIHLLDLPALLFSGIEMVEERQAAYASYIGRTTGKAASVPEEMLRFLRIEVGEERYGLNMKKVIAVAAIEELQAVTDGPPFLAGTVATRYGTVAVIDLQKKYQLDEVSYGPESLVIILQDDQYRYGVLANQVRDIAVVSHSMIKDSPVVLGKGEISHIKGVVIPEEGSGLFMIIDESKVLEKDAKRELQNMELTSIHTDHSTDRGKEKKRPYLIFQVAGIEFALKTDTLFKVIEYSRPKKVPKAPSHIRGILPVAGELVSIIDLQKKLALETSTPGPGGWIIVIKLPGKSLQGIIADAVTEIHQVAADEIVPTPDLAGPIDAIFADGVLLMSDEDNRSPLILNIERILNSVEPQAS